MSIKLMIGRQAETQDSIANPEKLETQRKKKLDEDGHRAQKILGTLRKVDHISLAPLIYGINDPEPPAYARSARLYGEVQPALESVNIKPKAQQLHLGTVLYDDGLKADVTVFIDAETGRMTSTKGPPIYENQAPTPYELARELVNAFEARHKHLKKRVTHINIVRKATYEAVDKAFPSIVSSYRDILAVSTSEKTRANLISDCSRIQTFREATTEQADQQQPPAKRKRVDDSGTELDRLYAAVDELVAASRPKQEDEVLQVLGAALEASEVFASFGSESETLTNAMKKLKKTLDLLVEKRRKTSE